MKALVIKGGISREREISLKSGHAVAQGLRRSGTNVFELDIKDNILEEILKTINEFKPDVIFPVLHGKFGEDGKIQAVLDIMKIPYVGSGVLGSAIGINKIKTKEIFSVHSIPSPKYNIFREGDDMDKFRNIEYPVFIKPNKEGSSIGAGKAEDYNELLKIIKESIKYDKEIIIEKFYKGRELTVGVIGNKEKVLLPIVEIKPHKGYFDFKSKYTKGETDYIVPAQIEECIEKEIYFYTSKIYEILELRGMSRIDLILTEDNFYFLEANTIPGFTETSLLPMAAQAAGISFEDLLKKLIDYAME